MPFFIFLLPLVLALSAFSGASAATYKIGVKTSLESFGWTEYYLNSEYVDIYRSENANDPVLQNLPTQNLGFGFGKSISSDGGNIRFASGSYDNWSSVGPCTGVFVSFTCNTSESYFGRLTGSFIDLSDYYVYDEYLANINSESGIIFTTYEPIYPSSWSNSLGDHRIGNSGFWFVSHRIDGISISQVPIPASGFMMMLSLAGLGFARKMRRP